MWSFQNEDQIAFLFFLINVPEAIRIKRSLAFLIKCVNNVSFSFRYNAWQLQNKAQSFKDRNNTVIGLRKKLTTSVAARNEACLETPRRMKLLQLLQLQLAPE